MPGTERDSDVAPEFKAMLQAAKQGDPYALVSLGKAHFENGELEAAEIPLTARYNSDQDPEAGTFLAHIKLRQGLRLLSEAAASGYATAKENLTDLANSIKSWRSASELVSLSVQVILGVLLALNFFMPTVLVKFCFLGVNHPLCVGLRGFATNPTYGTTIL